MAGCIHFFFADLYLRVSTPCATLLNSNAACFAPLNTLLS